MTATRPADILRQLDAGDPDADLLARFVGGRDQAAFAVLVRRHGPMVLAVCRRVTGHPQDAEDAFQAAFLTLARKAGAVGRPHLLGNWLYGVAVRVAGRARRAAVRRRRREVQVRELPDPPAPATEIAPDLGRVLHEELAALPAWYREAVVMCDLRGVPRAEAAHALGVPEGTLSSRLANGRKRLAERLARRGVTLAAAAVPMALADARASVPDQLLTRTCDLVAGWAAGGAVPGPLLRLIDGGFGMRQTFLVGAVGLALATTGVVAASRPAAQPPMPPDPPKAEAKPADPPKAKEPTKEMPLAAKPRLEWATDLPVTEVQQAVWETKRWRLAVRGTLSGTTGKLPTERVVLVVNPGEDRSDDQRVNLPSNGRVVGFEPDGDILITDVREYNLVSGRHRLQYWDVATEEMRPGLVNGQRAGIAISRGAATHFKPGRQLTLDPDPTFGYAFAADRKTFRTVFRDPLSGPQFLRLEVRTVDAATGRTLDTKLTVTDQSQAFELSPDGRRLAVLNSADSLSVYDVDRGERLWFVNADEARPKRYDVQPSFAFSPDGRQLLAVTRTGLLLFPDTAKPDTKPLAGDGVFVVQPGDATFSADGRLLALSGLQYLPTRVKTAEGEQWQFNRPPTRLLAVWDTTTGQVRRGWDRPARVAFHPSKPLLAVLEPYGDQTRLGVWDFGAENPK